MKLIHQIINHTVNLALVIYFYEDFCLILELQEKPSYYCLFIICFYFKKLNYFLPYFILVEHLDDLII